MNQAPSTVFYRGNDADPLSIALRDAKATKVPNSEWAAMDVNGKSVPTMEGRPYTIYRLKNRERRDHPIESGPWAFRVGPDASGALAQYVSAPNVTPPGVRKVSIREILQVLGNPNQKGYPGTANSDACLGFSAHTYQSAEVLFGPVGTRDDVLVRIEGLRRKGRNDKGNVRQKAKVGYCPCCAIPTHVGIPMSYRPGENDGRKQQSD